MSCSLIPENYAIFFENYPLIACWTTRKFIIPNVLELKTNGIGRFDYKEVEWHFHSLSLSRIAALRHNHDVTNQQGYFSWERIFLFALLCVRMKNSVFSQSRVRKVVNENRSGLEKKKNIFFVYVVILFSVKEIAYTS